MTIRQLRLDPFLMSILSVVLIATLLPCQGEIKVFFKYLTTAAIALLFFMHGAKLSRTALMTGVGHWKLHLAIFFSTFILFPILGVIMQPVMVMLLSPILYSGFLYLCSLPGTVQAAIAFTSVGKGNVPAAIFSSTLSSILGVFLSPLLVTLLLHQQSGEQDLSHAISSILLQLVAPFIAGHLSRPLLASWIERHKSWISKIDKSSILLVVYTAFSEAVVSGIWKQVNAYTLLTIIVVCCLLLAIVMLINILIARLLGFSLPDTVTLVFCGSKKSLVNGIPMANVLFPSATVGIMVLPLMLFHQLQMIVCAFLAQRYAIKIEKLQSKV